MSKILGVKKGGITHLRTRIRIHTRRDPTLFLHTHADTRPFLYIHTYPHTLVPKKPVVREGASGETVGFLEFGETVGFLEGKGIKRTVFNPI